MITGSLTVRELVREMQAEIGRGSLEPMRACDLLLRLTALVGNCNEQIRMADLAYTHVLLGYLDTKKAASRAKIRAETSQAYQEKREARDTKELAEELCRSLKYLIKSASEEMRLQR